jgi:hypothetical protein
LLPDRVCHTDGWLGAVQSLIEWDKQAQASLRSNWLGQHSWVEWRKKQKWLDRVGYLNDGEEISVVEIDTLIATAAIVAIVAATVLAAHPEMLILVPTW